MHVLDYDRALGELLELDDTVQKTIDRMFFLFLSQCRRLRDTRSDLKKIGQYDDTLIVVTADHGHGFVRRLNYNKFRFLRL
jgi:arylsulfatase A-like enzyme